MNDPFVMPVVPRPDVRSAEHGCCPVIADAFIHGRLAIILVVGRLQKIRPKIRAVPRDMMTIFVVNNSGIVGRISAIAFPGSFGERAVLPQLPARPEMNLALRRDRIILRNVILAAGQPVMAALEGPAIFPV